MNAEAIAINDVGSLVVENDRLVWYLVQSFPPQEREDWHGVGVIGLIKAARTFNPEANVKFATYAARCIQNEIRMELRKRRKQPFTTISLDADITDEGNVPLKDIVADLNVNIEQECVDGDEQEQLIHFLQEVVDEWSDRDRTILFMYSQGKRHREIADHLGLSQSYVTRVIQKLLEKARYESEDRQRELTAKRRVEAERRRKEASGLAIDNSYLDANFFDWETSIHLFANNMDMSYRDAIRWISQRDSLQQAAELMGMNAGSLPSLAEFLKRHGYKAPPETNGGNDKYTTMKSGRRKRKRVAVDMSTIKARLEEERKRTEGTLVTRQATAEELAKYGMPVVSKAPAIIDGNGANEQTTHSQAKERGEDIVSSFTLTRERYLTKRVAGESKNAIAIEQGVSFAGLQYRLEKWGLKDPDAEQAEIDRFRVGSEPDGPGPEHSAAGQDGKDKVPVAPGSSGSENQLVVGTHSGQPPGGEKVVNPLVKPYVTIRIPVRAMDLPDVISTATLDRTELLYAAFKLVQASVVWAYHDMEELIGKEDAEQHIQRYVDRRLKVFLGEGDEASQAVS